MLQEIAQKMDAPEGRVPSIALFNKITGASIAVMNAEGAPEDLADKYTTVEIHFDFLNDVLEGDYPNFRIVDRMNSPVVMTEEAMNTMAAGAITKKYKLVEQVNIIARAVAKLGAATGVELEELDDMLFFIKDTLRKNDLRKVEYASSTEYKYISDEQLAADESARLEGTGHIDLGPRPTKGGVVF